MVESEERARHQDDELEARRPAIQFPTGDEVSSGERFTESVFAEVDALLADRSCEEGRLDIEAGDSRLTCLVHRGRPYLAGLLEGREFSRVPLLQFPARARQLDNARWSLVRSDLAVVMILGVHFSRRPALEGSTQWIDIQHVLAGLAAERSDAALAFERDGARTLVFLHDGVPARIFFTDPGDDPGEGDITDRLLIHAFAPGAAEGWLGVFTDLKLQPEADAGRPLAELAREAQPPPAVNLTVKLNDGRQVSERPFVPPSVSIGRDQRADIFLDNLAVSRRHASIVWERGAFWLRDLGSANGTRLNGQQINSAEIEPGDSIEIGKFEIQLVEPQAASVFSETMMLSVPRVQRPIYLVAEDGASRELGADLVVGKGAGVDVEARGFRVHSVHARLQPVGSGSVSVSCFGRATVKINGEKTTSGRLTVGDKLVVGRSRFWLRWTPGDARVPG